MNRKSKILVPLLAIIAALALISRHGLTQEPIFSLPWFTFDGGGGRSSSGGLEVVGTAGQPDASVMAGGEFSLNGGFWYAAVTTDAAPDLSITQTVTPTVAEPGQVVTYVLTFRNEGNAMATGVKIDFTKPAQLIQTTFESGGLTVTAEENSNYALDAGNLASGTTGTVTITGMVDPAISEAMNLVSTAVISADVDAFAGNNQAEATLVVQPTQYEVYLPAVIR